MQRILLINMIVSINYAFLIKIFPDFAIFIKKTVKHISKVNLLINQYKKSKVFLWIIVF